MSITIDSFLPEVRPWAPGVPDATAFKAIRGAAIEFCERTKLWKYESTTPVLSTDPATSAISTPTDSSVFDIEVSLFDNKELVPKAPRDLDAIFEGWRTGAIGTGAPLYITQIEQNKMTMVPQSYADGSLYLCLRLKPSQTALTMPDFLKDYSECIGWGALGRILTVPGQSYSNPELATYYTGRFLVKLDALSRKGTTGQQNAVKRTKAIFL
ncbi:hypothetical protein UFOVP275_27 [uncultured Caudovirales phage]|uniref:Uncharacterized protein n=1 Tax=uncultured Caudovirales phage TaxID=2100421 RepID=A0A6J5LKZ5_9CAUD|nr:hypothetical protein UFOVP275_27 [uncultured Caudovirales phage]